MYRASHLQAHQIMSEEFLFLITEQASRRSRANSTRSCPLSFSPLSQLPALNISPASPDTAISIAFGLISTFIGLIGIFINYLTLRAMTPDPGTYIIHRSPLLFKHPLLLLNLKPNKISQGTDGNNRIPAERDQVLRHEHTHFVAPFTTHRKRAPSMA
jgi:hypothetical protein